MQNKKYNIYVNFDNKNKDIINQNQINITQNDYNSIEFDFIFDREEGTKVFELKKPDGSIWVKEIEQDGSIVLVDYDENENPLIVLNQNGTYRYEIAVYGENKKLTTSSIGEFNVRKELVNVSDDEVSSDDRLPILDNLINTAQELIDETNNLNIEAIKEDNTTTITITKKDGTTQETQILDGEQGEQGEQGETGNGISNISKTSSSGLVDTYTITYTNGNATTYDVTNGKDGEDANDTI